MKAAAYILLILIGALNMQPIFSSQKAMAETQCCSKEGCHKPKKQKQDKKDCESNGCNPFMACAIGNFYFTEKSLALSLLLPSLKQKFIACNDNRLSAKISDFWHPPENT